MLRYSKRQPIIFRAGIAMIGVLSLIALFAPLLASHSPYAVPDGQQRLAPSASHWFGTDQIGRDEFARIVYGARTSLSVGIGTAVSSGVIGLLVGVAAGWRGGRIDALLMRLTEIFLVIPGLLIAAALVVVIGRSVTSVVVVLAIAGWPVIARIARAEVVRVKTEGFVEAAHISGASSMRIIRVHVVPHVLPVVSTVVVTSVGVAILAESSLSFLNIGVKEPTASWGLMIASGRNFLTSSPHLILFPAGAVFVTVLAFVLTGSALRAVLGLVRA